MHPGKYCVYLHKINDEIIYVGKGNYYRPFDFTRAHSVEWGEKIKYAAVITVQIVKTFLTEKEAFELEEALIIIFKPSCNRRIMENEYDIDKTKDLKRNKN